MIDAPNTHSIQLGRQITFSILLSLTFFGLACVLPALKLADSNYPGFLLLLTGVFGLHSGQVAWFANPLLLISMITLFKRRWSFTFVLDLFALLLAADTVLVLDKPNTFVLVGYQWPAGTTLTLQGGFYIWIASIITVGIAAVVLQRTSARRRTLLSRIGYGRPT
jgi:hypothetical protein